MGSCEFVSSHHLRYIEVPALRQLGKVPRARASLQTNSEDVQRIEELPTRTAQPRCRSEAVVFSTSQSVISLH